ncbi:hypothetical protein [Oscillibacter sp. 1-3]|uniref:hypothetical protein n=1 Tax=Oscillibacter sp. 1-3 TaxID=1235797 RepID=UPI001A9989A5|nr:hypothetical protein [Oscillibacter sp. 1-3]
MFEKSQNAQTTDLFPPLCVDFPCNTQSMAASNRLERQKNLSPLHILPFIKQGLEKNFFGNFQIFMSGFPTCGHYFIRRCGDADRWQNADVRISGSVEHGAAAQSAARRF